VEGVGFDMNGELAKVFKSGVASPNSMYLVQFQDLSLHLLQTNERQVLKWTREEGLSSIKQVEILDPEAEVSHKFEYIKTYMDRRLSEMSVTHVLSMIIQRYLENARYLYRYLFSTRQVPISTNDSDIYGFDKKIVALST
jgi:hypothetical protein